MGAMRSRARRRLQCRLPMLEVTKDYRFAAADGSSRTLLDLFEGRHQLIVDHYMFDPDWEDGCTEDWEELHHLLEPGAWLSDRAAPDRAQGVVSHSTHASSTCSPSAS